MDKITEIAIKEFMELSETHRLDVLEMLETLCIEEQLHDGNQINSENLR